MIKINIRVGTIDLGKTALLVVLMGGLFYSSYLFMIGWWNSDDYTYCYLVVPIVLYLIWEKRARLEETPSRPSWAGIAPLVFGISLFWLGELAGEFTAMYFASWLLLVGLLWLHLGWEKLKVIWFPILFIIAMFPPPNFFHHNLTLQLKLISSQIGVAMMLAYGLSAYREGNIIDLGFTKLQVVDACSGLRYLYPLIIMAILLAYFYRGSLWKKALLVVSAIPLTIITNSLRIAMTGVLFEIWGPQVAEDFFHGFSGWFIFIFGLAVLLLEMWVLNGFRGLGIFSGLNIAESSDLKAQNENKVPELTTPVESASDFKGEADPSGIHSNLNSPNPPTHQNLTPRPTGLAAFLAPPQFVAAVILLVVTFALAQGVEFREKMPVAQSFAKFPLQVAEWEGKRGAIGQEFIDALKFSDYIVVDYRNSIGQGVNFYTAYYESQRKGESIHSPETCLPGAGWEFKNTGSVTLPIQARRGELMRVNKAFVELGEARQLSYFWFPQRDRVLTNAWELKIYNFWDALTRQRTDGALVRLITPVYPNEDVGQAEQRLTAFTQAIVPVLNEYLPK